MLNASSVKISGELHCNTRQIPFGKGIISDLWFVCIELQYMFIKELRNRGRRRRKKEIEKEVACQALGGKSDLSPRGTDLYLWWTTEGHTGMIHASEPVSGDASLRTHTLWEALQSSRRQEWELWGGQRGRGKLRRARNPENIAKGLRTTGISGELLAGNPMNQMMSFTNYLEYRGRDKR